MTDDLVTRLDDINRNYDLARGVHSTIRDAKARIDALTADNARLRAAFRVNMLRLIPGVTHADIDAAISAALNTGKEPSHDT